MNLQAKPAYWGIVDNTKLPGYGLAFSMTASGTGKQRTLNYTASNGVAGTAYATTITGVTVAPVVAGGCTPSVATSTPLLIGDVAAGGKGSGAVTLNFGSSCKAGSYVVTTSWSIATYDTGSLRSIVTYTP
jgi:endo-1,4-beta-xylanase